MRAFWLVLIQMNFFSHSFKGVITLCFFISFLQNVQASDEQALRETVVTASRTEQIVTDVIPHTTVLGREAIEQSQLIDLPSLLAREAGFQFTQNGGRGTAATAYLRGAASMQVLVLVDGVPMTKQDTTGSVSLEHIMLDQVDRIEIVRGNVSAVYGSGAVGGVIQVFTREGDTKPRTYITTEVGSYRSQRLLAGTQGQTGDLQYVLSVGSNSTNGISAMNPIQNSNVNPDSNGYKNDSYALNLIYKLNTDNKVGFRANGSNGRFTNDSGFGAPTDINSGTSKIDGHTLYWTATLSDSWKSKLNISDNVEQNTVDSLGSSPYKSVTQTHTQLVSWVNELNFQNVVLTAGLDHQQQTLDADDGSSLLNKKRSADAIYSGLLYTEQANSLQFNLRHDDVQGIGSKNSLYLGYGRNLGEAWKLTAAHSTAFNVAPLGYLYDPYSGNPNLKSETAATNEVGLQWASNGHVVRSTLFSTRTKDLLLFDEGTGKFGNVSSSQNQGLESSYSGRLDQTDIRASLTLQNPINEETGARLVRRAQTLGSLSVSQLVDVWTLGASLRYTGVRPDTASNPGLGSYLLIDTTARYKLSNDWVLFGRVENLTDQTYQTAYGYNQLPRTFYIGASWNMKH